jgi:hypothetical protein
LIAALVARGVQRLAQRVQFTRDGETSPQVDKPLELARGIGLNGTTGSATAQPERGAVS